MNLRKLLISMAMAAIMLAVAIPARAVLPYRLTRSESDSVACALATIWGEYTRNKANKDGAEITAEYMRGLSEAIEKSVADDAYYHGLEQGVAINNRLRQVETMGGFTVDRKKFLYELDKATKGRRTGFTKTTAEGYMNYIMECVDRRNNIIETSKAYLEKESMREGVEKTPSGLLFEVITEGEGRTPGPNDVVLVNYVGTLPSGTLFNKTDANNPKMFQVAETVAGFGEGLQKMKVGGRYRLVIPPELAYGEAGVGDLIPGGSVVIFEVELVDMRTAEEMQEIMQKAAERQAEQQAAQEQQPSEPRQ